MEWDCKSTYWGQETEGLEGEVSRFITVPGVCRIVLGYVGRTADVMLYRSPGEYTRVVFNQPPMDGAPRSIYLGSTSWGAATVGLVTYHSNNPSDCSVTSYQPESAHREVVIQLTMRRWESESQVAVSHAPNVAYDRVCQGEYWRPYVAIRRGETLSIL